MGINIHLHDLSNLEKESGSLSIISLQTACICVNLAKGQRITTVSFICSREKRIFKEDRDHSYYSGPFVVVRSFSVVYRAVCKRYFQLFHFQKNWKYMSVFILKIYQAPTFYVLLTLAVEVNKCIGVVEFLEFLITFV